jgi:hypothetical protein
MHCVVAPGSMSKVPAPFVIDLASGQMGLLPSTYVQLMDTSNNL